MVTRAIAVPPPTPAANPPPGLICPRIASSTLTIATVIAPSLASLRYDMAEVNARLDEMEALMDVVDAP